LIARFIRQMRLYINIENLSKTKFLKVVLYFILIDIIVLNGKLLVTTIVEQCHILRQGLQ